MLVTKYTSVTKSVSQSKCKIRVSVSNRSPCLPFIPQPLIFNDIPLSFAFPARPILPHTIEPGSRSTKINLTNWVQIKEEHTHYMLSLSRRESQMQVICCGRECTWVFDLYKVSIDTLKAERRACLQCMQRSQQTHYYNDRYELTNKGDIQYFANCLPRICYC